MHLETVYSNERVDDLERVRKFMTNVYAWMAIGILTTAITSLFTIQSKLYVAFVKNPIAFFGIVIAELAVVIFLSARINKMSSTTAMVSFIIYAVLNGLTLSLVFLMYTSTSIASTFFITAAMFGATSFYGMVTKKDLSSWGNILFMGLIGIIIASLVNLLLKSPALYYMISYIGVVLFTALTAYDTQAIKNLYLHAGESQSMESTKKMAVFGALKLYLDFINLFLYLLRIFGKRD